MEGVESVGHLIEGGGCMSGELREHDEVEQSARGMYDTFIICTTGEDSDENLFHLLILCTGPLFDVRDSLREVAKRRVIGEGHEAAVQFSRSHELHTPRDEMVLEDSFVKLMKDVGGDGRKDVAVWEILPERLGDGTKPLLLERYLRVLITAESATDYLGDLSRITRLARLHCSSFIALYQTLRTPILHAACDQTLLWIICFISGEDGMNVSLAPIGTDHANTILSSNHHRVEHMPEALVKDLVRLQ